MHDRVGYLARTALNKRPGDRKYQSDPPQGLCEGFAPLGWRGTHRHFEDFLGRELASYVPEVADIAYRMNEEHFPITPLLYCHAFREAKYLLHDAERFRAARVALAFAEPGGKLWFSYGAEEEALKDASQWVAYLNDWRSLFSPSRQAYRALNQTLDAFDENIDLNWFTTLRTCRLPRQIPSLLHFQLTQELCRLHQFQGEHRTRLLARIYAFCEEEIEAAIQLWLQTNQ